MVASVTDVLRMCSAVVSVDDKAAMTTIPKDRAFSSDEQRGRLLTGHVVSVFSYTDDWNYRERHPSGDELVYVVAGEVSFVLGPTASERLVDLRQGDAVVVPADTWHRARFPEPATLLFITPAPAHTVHEPVVHT